MARRNSDSSDQTQSCASPEIERTSAMSVEEIESVDAIGISRATNEVTLVIADHLDWRDGHRHMLLLQEKLNTYLRFLESGEVYQAYPKARGRRFVIEIVGQHDPTDAAKEFLAYVTRAIDAAGFALRFRRE
jgi:hypothetical protein